jgi:dipeptidyl-peptidase 4
MQSSHSEAFSVERLTRKPPADGDARARLDRSRAASLPSRTQRRYVGARVRNAAKLIPVNAGAAILLSLASAVAAVAQGSAEDYRRADALPGAWTNLLRNESVEVRWIDADTPVYRYALADGTEQWRTVDLATGTIRPFFDERSIVDGLRNRGVDVDRTPEIPWFDAHDGRLLMAFRGDTRLWAWDDRTRSLDELDPSELPDRFVLAPQPIDRTRSGGPVTSLIVVNASATPVRLVWLDHDARARPYATIDPGAVHRQHTFAGHAWRVLDPLDADLGSYVASDGPGLIMVRDAAMAPVPPVPPDPPAPSVRPSAERSPDGRFTVEFSDHQVVLNDRDGTRMILTQDGHEGDRYEGPVRWSPDSTRFVAMRTVPGDDRRIHMIESSPPDRLEPRLVSHRYRKPGDRVDVSRPRLFDATRGEMIDVDDALIDEPWSVGGVEWAPDSTRFYYLFNGRGHRIVRLIAVDARTGATRVVVEERSETFIDWTNKIFVHRIDATGELLWMSERSGWNHLYLIDLESGAVRNAVTAGDWVVRGVDHVDDETREVRLRVMGVRDGEDPYHVHYARVGFDGSGLSMLTEGDGTHRIDFSPDGSHYVNVWSRADLPPVTELRRTSDGALVATLAEDGRAGLHRGADRRHGHQPALQGVSRRLLEEPRRRRLSRPHRLDQGRRPTVPVHGSLARRHLRRLGGRPERRSARC